MTKFSVDSENRLIITETVKKSFPQEEGSTLKAKAIYDKALYNLSRGKVLEKTALEGEWSLTEDYNLSFRSSVSDSIFSAKTFIVYGEIESVSGNSLNFRARTSDPEMALKACSLQLRGKWQADKDNRLTFLISKTGSAYDVLTFQGAWQVNKNNEVIFTHKRSYLKTKTKQNNLLVFKGFWELGEKKLVYRLEKGEDSFFAFRVALESKDLTIQGNRIKYTVGIKYQKKNVYKKTVETVSIYGTWHVNKDLKVAFEVHYSGIRREKIVFLIEKLIKKGEKITLLLENSEGEKLGIRLTFSKTFKSDAELFLSLARFPKESRIEGGIKVRF